MKQLLKYIGLLLAVISCRVDPPIPTIAVAAPLGEIVPEGWPRPLYTFSTNTVSKEKFELGRALFYEPMLSRDNTISCGSCHQQVAAFANAGHSVSHGINDLEGNRNSPALFNLAWHPSFMHDGGVNHIEVQPLAPISNPVEMDEDLGRVLDKLRASERYRQLFTAAFGTAEISSQRMLHAITQFQGLMYSFNSRFDLYKRREKGANFSDIELAGYQLFVQKCNSCHAEPLFSDFRFRNNGLKPDRFVVDSGRARITREPADLYRFKTPSLRNIAKTAPYMHDGRFETLEACLDHYTDGNLNHTNLDPLLEYGIAMDADEKKKIIAFLQTLTDYTFLDDKRFSDPRGK
jgi:cytochrome c peroxidase